MTRDLGWIIMDVGLGKYLPNIFLKYLECCSTNRIYHRLRKFVWEIGSFGQKQIWVPCRLYTHMFCALPWFDFQGELSGQLSSFYISKKSIRVYKVITKAIILIINFVGHNTLILAVYQKIHRRLLFWLQSNRDQRWSH